MRNSVIVTGLVLFLFATTSYISRNENTEVTLQELEQLYREYYLASAIDSIPWNGSIATCKPGNLPAEVLEKAGKRINFFRSVCRLPLVVMDNDSALYPQAAALMMMANKRLSHNPSTSWKCFSKAGAKGANASCLGLPNFKDFPEDAFINGFLKDWGEENAMVGHRRWVLYSKMKRFSYGATGGAEALYCIMNDLEDNPKAPQYIAYPWSGYVPYNLIYAKWSFALPEAANVSFKNTKVTITNAKGEKMKIKVYPFEEFLDPTLVWYMEDMYTPEDELYGVNKVKERGFVGQTITVSLANVLVNGVTKTYTYTVKIVDLDYLGAK